MLDRDMVMTQLKQLPALPGVVSELISSFADEDVDIARIAQLIGRDQGLTARVLRVANSSFYGLQSKVGTINEALVVLGFRAVRSMALATGVSGVFHPEKCPGFELPGYLRHSIGVGLTARALAAQTGHNPDLAFVGGVLHDIGQLVLASGFPTQYAEALRYRQQHDCYLVVAERDILGFDHAEVGGMLSDAWRFPASLHEAVAGHHAPSESVANSLADLIHVADAIAHGLGLARGNDEMVIPLDRTAWTRLNLDSEKLQQILTVIAAEMDETFQAFSA